MSVKLDYNVNSLALLNRKAMNDVRIYEWIACSRFLIPSLTVHECAKSWLHFHHIKETDISIDKIVKTYNRMQADLFEEQKTVNQFPAGTKI
jgi:hypothetical protein